MPVELHQGAKAFQKRPGYHKENNEQSKSVKYSDTLKLAFIGKLFFGCAPAYRDQCNGEQHH